MNVKLPYIIKVMFASVLSILFVGVATTFATDFGLAEVSDSGLAISNDFTFIEIIARIIRILLGLLGIIVVGLFLYAGFTWMTAAGNAEKIETAKKIMFNAVIGLVIIFSSFAITQFVINRLADATGSGNTNQNSDDDPTLGNCDPLSTEYSVILCEEYCRENPLASVCFDRDFYVTSISPSTEDGANATNMNNIQVRVIFSKPIHIDVITNAISLTKDGVVVPATPVLEPHTKTMIHLIPEKDLEDGTYLVSVNDELVDVTGDLIDTNYTDRRGNTYKTETSFTVNRDFEDDRRPDLVSITLNGEASGQTVFIGGNLHIEATAQDRNAIPPFGGISYADVRVVSDGRIPHKLLGPRVRDVSAHTFGSSEAFSLSFTQPITADLFTSGRSYYIYTGIHDLQSDRTNSTVAKAMYFTVYADHCNNGVQDEDETGVDTGGACGGDEDDACTVDADCSPYMRCLEGSCIPTPIILGLDPTDAADGNWVTVVGRYFGTVEGSVEFGIEQDDDSFEWVKAELPGLDVCPLGNLWQDDWIIVTVPTSGTDGVTFEVGDIAAIRVVTAGGSVTSDLTMDDTVNDRGPQTRFTKSEINRPGLCSVVDAVGGNNVGESGSETNWNGQGFVSGITSPVWGGIFGEVSSFSSATFLTSVIPNGISNGRIGVYVQEGTDGPRSNGIPFFIENVPPDTDPVITSVDPEKTTNSSLVTISGTNFGTSTGVIFLGSSADVVRSCADSTPDECIRLVVDLPQQCEATWSDTQVVVLVSDQGNEIPEGTYSLLLKTATGRISDGSDVLTVNDGPPLPGICSISPDNGPAPLSGDNTIKIFGTNFGSQDTHDLRYWNTGASTTDATFTGWFNSGFDASGTTIVEYTDTRIEARLPVIQSGISKGLSIPLNIPVPIRVQDTANARMSNAVTYTANVCTEEGAPEGFHCCTAGADAGKLRPDDIACEGQPRDAGYTWRFSSGVIPRVPYVLERCEVGSLPTPSPSDTENSGEQVCVNALVVVQFSETMDPTTISPSSVRMFACERKRGGCSDVNLVTTESLQFDGDNTLRIFGGEGVELDIDTWYSVELDTSLTSRVSEVVAGYPVTHNEPLRATADCGRDTAYCFDFKTSEIGASCNVASAYIVPGNRTATALGPLEVYEGRLQQFQVYGAADQECIALDVSDLNWTWGAYSTLLDGSLVSPALSQISVVDILDARNDIKTIDIQNDPLVVPVKLAAEYTNDLDGLVELDSGQCISGPFAGDACLINENCDEAVSCVDGVCAGSGTACTLDLECTIEHSCELFDIDTINTQSVTGSSTIIITIGDPAPSDFYPNCAAACTNATLGVRFNRNMVTSTFSGTDAVLLRTCTDETCTSVGPAPGGAVSITDITSRGFVIVPGEVLAQDQWYQVELANTIASIGGYRDGIIIPGDTIETFTWRFKTKDTFDGCFINTIDIEPNGYVARAVGEQNVFSVFPYGTPDVCSPYGQQLNPWDYDWNWGINDVSDAGTVAILTDFAQDTISAPGCTESCLPVGSTEPLGSLTPFICGNNIIEPGETCEIGNSLETPGGLVDVFDESGAFAGQVYAPAATTCTYSCQRPGNGASGVDATVALCGNGVLDNPVSNGQLAGEECDDGNTANGDGCSDICVNEGSTFELVTGEVEGGLCNGEIITIGEECEIINATTVAIAGVDTPFTVPDASAYCSDTCLMSGTPIAASWCAVGTRGDLDACAAPTTVCGNGVLEVGEQCEYDIIGGSPDKTFIRGEADSIALDPAVVCSSQCIVQNACNTAGEVYASLEDAGVACEAGTEGCTDACTFAGSSVYYSTPSICGDGLISGAAGIGEYAACEVTPDSSSSFTAPVQIATAVGESTVVEPDTGSQHAIVSVEATQYTSLEGVLTEFNADDIAVNTSSYYLQCGYTEYETPEVIEESENLEYNNCWGDDGGHTQGVAENSCCYPRPEMDLMYPTDFDTNVCRNTLLTATFEGEIIESASLRGNVLIAEHTTGDCEDPRADITSRVQNVFAAVDTTTERGFFGTIWNGMKTLFARMIAVVHADHPISVTTGSWCDTGIELEAEVAYDSGVTAEDGSLIPANVDSTIQVTIKELLKGHTNYSVLLKSTAGGITNYRGIPIQTRDRTSIYDGWVFQTGEAICKIAEVAVFPPSHVYTAPETSAAFRIAAKTQRDELIVPIPGTYSWEYDWAPQANPLFDIPVPESIENERDNTADIRVRDREGTLSSLGIVVITEDSDPSDSGNQTGKRFIDTADLHAIFCANIWPGIEGSTWYPYRDAVEYNYQFSYCADAGLASTSTDDLPFFNLPPIEPTLSTDTFGYCSAGAPGNLGTSCDEDTECGGTVPVFGTCIGYTPEILATPPVCTSDLELIDGICENVTTVAETIPGVGNCQYKLIHYGEAPNDFSLHDFPGESCSVATDCPKRTVSDFDTSRFQNICTQKYGKCKAGTELVDNVCNAPEQCWNDGVARGTNDCTVGSVPVGDGAPVCVVGPKKVAIHSGETCSGDDFCDVIVPATCGNIGSETTTETIVPGTCNTSPDSCSIDADCPHSFEPVCFTAESSDVVPGTCSTDETLSCTRNADCTVTGSVTGICSPTAPSDEILDRKIFLNDLNDDALGIQIFKNTDRQSSRDWYNDRFNDGNAYQSLSIDGYDAITNGSNYFINALNVSYSDVGSVNEIFNNIYQLTISESAQANTREAFEQIINSLEFNINVSDHGYCLAPGYDRRSATVDFGDVDNQIACTTDFDCRDSNGSPLQNDAGVVVTSGSCSNNRTALLRDFERLQEVQLVQSELEQFRAENGTYPTMAAGSYYPGYTVSRWPSWGRLQQDVGTLPTDPINTWTDCGDLVDTDQQTCWDAVLSEYHCPAFSSVYEYRVENAAATDYTLHTPLEYLRRGDPIVGTFVTQSDFSTVPWCVGTRSPDEVGTCGDGILQTEAEEECENPGDVIREACGTGSTAGFKVQTCSADCQLPLEWSDISLICAPLTNCGNGVVEGAEICDDGDALNGTYGHCSNSCDFASAAFCGNGSVDAIHEICDYSVPDQNKGVCSNVRSIACTDNTDCPDLLGNCIAADDASYGNREWHRNDGSVIKVIFDVLGEDESAYDDWLAGYTLTNDIDISDPNIYSCNNSCSARGNYCGDGIVQEAYEECDDGNRDDTDSCKNRCEITVNPAVDPDELAGTCGDGVIQAPNDELVNEVCDLGSQNGIRPTVTPYGDSVSYCSADCREVLTVDALTYCGDGIVQENERCDVQVTAGGTDVYVKQCTGGGSSSDTYNDICLSDIDCEDGNTCEIQTSPESCQPDSDYGTYQCLNDCQVVTNDCTSCGLYAFKKTGSANLESERDIERWFYGDRHPEGAIPKLALLNPLIANNSDYRVSGQSRFTTTTGSYDGVVVAGGNIDSYWGKKKGEGLNNDGSFFTLYKWNDVVSENPTYMGYSNFAKQYTGDVDDSSSPVIRESQEVPPNYYNYLFYFGVKKGVTSTITNVNYNTTQSIYTTLETDAYCSEEYKVVFNTRRLGEARHDNAMDTSTVRVPKDLVNDGLTDAFEFPVNNETSFVENAIVTSPAVPKEVLRVVVRSKKHPGESIRTQPKFTLNAYSPTFKTNSNGPRRGFSEMSPSSLCRNMVRTDTVFGAGGQTFSERERDVDGSIANKDYTVQINTTTINPTFLKYYWWPKTSGNDSCLGVGPGANQIFIHDIGNSEDNQELIQSFTIDARRMTNGVTIPIFVTAIGQPVQPYQTRDDVVVEIYEYHEGQVPGYSFYKPTRTFTISESVQSSNPLAPYWHAFNLMPNNSDEGYRINTVGSEANGAIKTRFCDIRAAAGDPCT